MLPTKEIHVSLNDINTLRMKGWKKSFQANGNQKKQE